MGAKNAVWQVAKWSADGVSLNEAIEEPSPVAVVRKERGSRRKILSDPESHEVRESLQEDSISIDENTLMALRRHAAAAKSVKDDFSADVGTSSPEHGQSEEHALDGSSAESHDTTSREREQLTEIVDDPSDTIQAAEPVTIAYEYLLQQNVLHPTLLKDESSARNSGEVPKMKNKTIAERSRRHLVLNDRVDIWTK
ncbi:hypothetical protein COOONC_10762, partial [Cooperia oncophora]